MKKKFLTLFWIIASLVSFSSCIPSTQEASCGESEAYDIETRQCVPVAGASPNTIFIDNSSPVSVYTDTIGSAPVEHSISVNDSFNLGHDVEWFVSHSIGNTINSRQSVLTGSSNFTFNSAALFNAGNYIIEAVVRTNAGLQVDTQVWNVSIVEPLAPTLINPSPISSTVTYAASLNSATLSVELSNPNAVTGNFQIFVDGVLDPALTSSGPFTGAPLTASITIDPSNMAQGIHAIEVQLNDGAGFIYNRFVWTVNIIPEDLPVIITTAPSFYDSISIVDSIDFASGGFRDISNNPLTEVCVTVDDFDKDGDLNSDVDIAFEINGQQQGALGTFAANQYCHNTFITQTLANPDVSEGKTLTVKILKAGTPDVVEIRQWNLNIRPRNLRPEIKIDSINTAALLSCTADSPISYSGCQATQSVDADNNGDYTNSPDDVDNSMVFALELIQNSDPDIQTDDQFETVFQIRRQGDPVFQGIDGTSSLTKADCTYALAELPATGKARCALPFDAFNSVDGNIDPGTYEVQAFIRDGGSIWDPIPKESNRVVWTVEVSEQQDPNSISIAAQAIGVGVNESWIESSNSSCTPTNIPVNSGSAIAENDYVIVHTFVRDIERDSFDMTIKLENSLTGGGFTTVAPLQFIARNDDAEFYEVESCFRIPEWAVVTNNATISLQVSVTDRPDDTNLTSATATAVLSLLVNNDNPAPTFADTSVVDLSPFSVMPGAPFVITATTYTDNSVFDGAVVTYQWQVSTDAGVSWADIPNANSTDQITADLIWTPNIDITATTASLRLCLGDDGDGNPSDCSNPLSTKEYADINIISANSLAGSYISATSTDQEDRENISTWFDETNSDLYTVYSLGRNIYINKQTTNTDGQLEDFHTINFPTEDNVNDVTAVPLEPSNVSITGIDGNTVLVSYTSPNNVSGHPFIRVRRIDISNGDLAFSYGGFFTGEADATDRVENISYNATPSLSLSALGDGDMSITVAEVNNGDQISITTSSGNVDLVVGNNPGDLCNPTACPTPATLAANIASFINNNTNFEISRELTAEHTTGSATVLIRGAGELDFYDEASEITSIIGNISIDNSNTYWVVPYADITNDLTLSTLRGINPTVNLSATIASTNAVVGSSQFNKEVRGQYNSLNEYVMASVNTNNNLDLIRLNTTTVSTLSSIINAHVLGGYQVSDIDLSIGFNDIIYVASRSIITASSITNLGVVVANANLTDHVSNIDFTVVSDLVSNLEKVKVSASPTELGVATLAVLTEADHPSPNSLFAAQISHPATPGSFATSINFHISNDVNYSPVSLNQRVMTTSSNIAITPIYNLTRGFISEASVAADSIKPFMFLSYMQENAANREINTTVVNTQREEIQSGSNISGSGAALIKN